MRNERASHSYAHIPPQEKTRGPRTISAAERSIPEALQAPAAEAEAEAQAVWQTSRHPREHSASIPLLES